MRRNFAHKTRGIEWNNSAVTLTAYLGTAEKEMVFSTGYSDVKEAAFFGVARFLDCFLAGKHGFAKEEDEDDFEFEPFGLMNGT